MNRRSFAAGAFGTIAMAGRPGAAAAFRTAPVRPLLLDHLVWLAADLESACGKFQAMSGIVPAYGGRHPSGTHNALVALGPTCYLEIAAPQPGVREGHPWVEAALRRPEPHLHAYCMRTRGTLDGLAERVRGAGHRVLGPAPGSRTLPDGRELHWRLLIPLIAGTDGTMPFFIDWLDTPNPAVTAPAGARLTNFTIRHPDPSRINIALALLGSGLRATTGDSPGLTARISSPRGTVVLTS